MSARPSSIPILTDSQSAVQRLQSSRREQVAANASALLGRILTCGGCPRESWKVLGTFGLRLTEVVPYDLLLLAGTVHTFPITESARMAA